MADGLLMKLFQVVSKGIVYGTIQRRGHKMVL